jgi:hypothetical protein
VGYTASRAIVPDVLARSRRLHRAVLLSGSRSGVGMRRYLSYATCTCTCTCCACYMCNYCMRMRVCVVRRTQPAGPHRTSDTHSFWTSLGRGGYERHLLFYRCPHVFLVTVPEVVPLFRASRREARREDARGRGERGIRRCGPPCACYILSTMTSCTRVHTVHLCPSPPHRSPSKPLRRAAIAGPPSSLIPNRYAHLVGSGATLEDWYQTFCQFDRDGGGERLPAPCVCTASTALVLDPERVMWAWRVQGTWI